MIDNVISIGRSMFTPPLDVLDLNFKKQVIHLIYISIMLMFCQSNIAFV